MSEKKIWEKNVRSNKTIKNENDIGKQKRKSINYGKYHMLDRKNN